MNEKKKKKGKYNAIYRYVAFQPFLPLYTRSISHRFSAPDMYKVFGHAIQAPAAVTVVGRQG